MTITANLNCVLNLKLIFNNVTNVEYKKQRFERLIIRIRKPYTTCLAYASGKIVLMGAKSLKDGRKSVRLIARKIQKIGFNLKITDITIENIA